MMRRRLIQLATLAACCLTLAAMTTTMPIRAAGDYTVLSTTELDLVGGPASTHAHISPSGETFAYGKGDQLCIYTITGEEQACSTQPKDAAKLRPDPESVVWAPDGSKIAFSSQFLQTFRNPGIWVMDAKTAEITQVTGMGYETANLLKDDVVFDLSPQWLDSQHLVFLRYSSIKGKRTGPIVGLLDVNSGEVKDGGDLNYPNIDVYLTGISADGKLLAYNNDGRDVKADGGLWVYDIAKQTKTKLYSIEQDLQTPRVMSFNADASQILITDSVDFGMPNFAATPKGFDPTKSTVHIVDVASGKVSLVDDTRYVRRAGWSPDGKAIAYIVYDPIQKPDINGLYISTEPGKPGKLVLPGYFIVPTGREGQPILWATNDTLIISDRDRGFKLTVVKLGVK